MLFRLCTLFLNMHFCSWTHLVHRGNQVSLEYVVNFSPSRTQQSFRTEWQSLILQAALLLWEKSQTSLQSQTETSHMNIADITDLTYIVYITYIKGIVYIADASHTWHILHTFWMSYTCIFHIYHIPYISNISFIIDITNINNMPRALQLWRMLRLRLISWHNMDFMDMNIPDIKNNTDIRHFTVIVMIGILI
jgi:hypothetical protein